MRPSAGGEPLPCLGSDIWLCRPQRAHDAAVHERLKAGAPLATEIPVERINGPILLIPGADDEVGPPTAMAERIVARFSRAGFAHGVATVVYPGGHCVLTGDIVLMLSRPVTILIRADSAASDQAEHVGLRARH